MRVASALALVALLATGDSLLEAQRAFSEGRYEAAERLALEAAQPPRSGAALYLVGLARFREGRPAEALEALDAAGRAEDAPERASWSFNRGACLYALERFGEAEQAFIVAATDTSLAPVAWANAGFAALDAGSPERAEQWAERARAGASVRALALVEDLRAQIAQAQGRRGEEGAEAYRQGLSAFDAGRFAEARTHFLRAAQLDASSGRARLMAGASAYRLGDRATAREEIASALTLKLEPEARETALDYLDRLSFGLRANGRGVAFSVGAGAGFDSNVLQVGVAPRDAFATTTGSPFGEVGLGLAARFRLSDMLFAELAYGGSQRAYLQSSAEDYSLQLHRVAAAVELETARHWRLGASANGDVFFTGLSDFRGLQASVGGLAWLALDESDVTSTRLDASLTRKVGLGTEFSYLTGNRWDALLSQELRLQPLVMTGWYRYREDRIGTLTQTTSADGTGTALEYVIPYAWRGHAAGASARWDLGAGWEFSLTAGVEWRNYLSESFVRLQAADGTVDERDRRLRRDVRFVLGPALSAPLTKHLLLSARYDLLVNQSNVDTRLHDAANACVAPDAVCHRYDYTNGNYQKHMPMLELSGTW